MDDAEKMSAMPAVGQVMTPVEAMDLALREGLRGAGFVAPNPLVGCTILDREHRFLSVGYHRRVGFDHAEIDALKKLPGGVLLEGAHIFVTLEPCAHQGRTPSCARTLAPLKPATVTYAVEDPNPLVAGRGAAILREAGVRTMLLGAREDISVEDRERLRRRAEILAEIFLHNHRCQELFVAIKVASSLDGQIALTSGESKWITNDISRGHAHAIRARYDAIAIGVNTLINDDPALNVRHPQYPSFENKVVILDPEAKSLPLIRAAKLAKVRPPESVFIVVGEKAAAVEVPGCQILVVREVNGSFDLADLMAQLRSRGLTSLMVEGGAQTISSFLRAGLVQRLHLYLAPSLLGGQHALGWTSGFGIETMASKMVLRDNEREILGDDLYWTAVPHPCA